MHNTWAHRSGDLSGSTAILSTFQDGILVMAGVGDSGDASHHPVRKCKDGSGINTSTQTSFIFTDIVVCLSLRYTTVCYCVYHIITPPGAVFQARLLVNQEGANAERYVFGKLSARRFQRRPFWPRHYANCCGDIDHGKSAQGGLV